MASNRILFIVEGEGDEVPFIRRLLSKCSSDKEYDFYTYRCNIHVLSQILFDEYPDFEDDEVDIQLILKSKERDRRKKEKLSRKYQDIFLIFDLDPQHDHPHFDTIFRMLKFFNDSSDHGKLFINYPMMQSYKHFSTLPDDSFADRCVTINECQNYKKIVGDMSKYTDINEYSYRVFISLLVHHLKKANYILTGRYILPDYEDYILWEGSKIFEKQYHFLEENESVYVLNTCIFLLVDFKPMFFFRSLKHHLNEFDI